MNISLLKISLLVPLTTLIACTNSQFSPGELKDIVSANTSASSSSGESTYSSGETASSNGQSSGGQVSTIPTMSDAGQIDAVLPATKCANVRRGEFAFKLGSAQDTTFQNLEVTAMSASPKGFVEVYAIFDDKSGSLIYDLTSTEIVIDSTAQDDSYVCGVTYPEALSLGKTMGYQTYSSLLGHLKLQGWLNSASSPELTLVGMAAVNKKTNELAVQCF